MPTLKGLNPGAEGLSGRRSTARNQFCDNPQSRLPCGQLVLEAFAEPMLYKFTEFEVRSHAIAGVIANQLEGSHFTENFQALTDGARAKVQAGLDVRITQRLGTREANPINGGDGLRHTEQIRGVEKKNQHFLFERHDLARPTFGSNQGPRQTRRFGARAELWFGG